MPLPMLETSAQTKRRPRYRRVEAGERPALKLTDRDRELLKHIYDYRFITAAMLQDLVEPPQLTQRQQEALERLIAARRSRTNSERAGEGLAMAQVTSKIPKRLQALYHHGYVQRHKLSDHDPIIYALGNRGADVLTLHYGIDRQQIDWTSKNREVGEHYIHHSLMASRFRHALTLALRQQPDATLDFWEPNGVFKASVAYEDTIRTSDGGARTYPVKSTVIPDGFFALRTGDTMKYLFVEADRSTMTNGRYLAKLKAYFQYWMTKVRNHQHPVMDSFRVLTITLSEARKENLRTIAREVDPKGRGLNLFLFVCEQDYHDEPSQVLAPIWQTPGDESVRSILGDFRERSYCVRIGMLR